MSHAQSTLSLLRDLRYERSTGLLLAWPIPELDLLHNLTVLDGEPLGTIEPNSTKSVGYPGAVGGTSDTTLAGAKWSSLLFLSLRFPDGHTQAKLRKDTGVMQSRYPRPIARA
jgi:hypothetical protein